MFRFDRWFVVGMLLLFSQVHAQQVDIYVPAQSGITDGLVMDSQGNLYGCDFEGETVYKVTTDGQVTAFADGFDHPNGMTVDANDNVYLASTWDHAVYRISPEGTVEQYGATIQNPNGVLFDPQSDTLIVTSYALNEVRKMAPDGTLYTWISGGDLNGPLGLAFDSENRLYVANFNDGKVFRVQADTLVHLATIPSGGLWGGTYACGFLTCTDDYLYATGIAVNRIYRISLDGEMSVFAGTGQAGTVNGDALAAQFNTPNGITTSVNGETLFISDFTTQSIRRITDLTTDVYWQPVTLPAGCVLKPAYPNPFNSTVIVPFELDHAGEVAIAVYDLLGRQLALLEQGMLSPGQHRVHWDGAMSGGHVASGTYILRLEVEGAVSMQRLTLVK